MKNPLVDAIRRDIQSYSTALAGFGVSGVMSRNNLNAPTDRNIVRLADDLRKVQDLLKRQHKCFEGVVEKLLALFEGSDPKSGMGGLS